jgi:hypothetical protein
LRFLSALQLGKHTIAQRIDSDVRDLFSQPKRDTELAQVVGQRFDDLPIYEVEYDWPLVDQCNLGTQSRHERCVLEAHHAGAYDDDLFRETVQLGKVIGIHDATIVKGNVGAVRGPRAAGNQDLRRFEFNPFAAVLNFHCMGI